MATVDLGSLPIVVVPPTAVTLEGFRAWMYSDEFPEEGRVTFIDGRLFIEMSPERYETHVKLKGEVSLAIGNLVKERDLGDLYVDGAGLSNKSAGLSSEPDAFFASWQTLESGKLAPPPDYGPSGTHKDMMGTPDWVLEVVSNSSVAKDKKHLLAAYHKAGIPEYWLIDARGEEIDFQLLVWAEDEYKPAAAVDGWLKSSVFDCEFKLARSRDRLDRWRYDLSYRHD